MKNLLWLDDLRNPFLDKEKRVPLGNDKWNINWVLNFEQFTEWIEIYGLPDAISFDHDLAPEHYTPEYFWDDYDASKNYQEWKKKSYTTYTGEYCAKWLVSYCNKNKLDLPIYYIHSANPVGADFILNALTIK
tara:strand:- start:75 stop:473 length:399 start_codon:yes stop_codon:yes gene_type:complete